MASLTHVCMWSDNGWKRITAEQAARLHPGGTVSAHSGLFMCELCGQYVILTDGDIRIRYFKHSAYEKSKDCPERTFGAGYSISYGSQEHDLPIRITSVSSYGRWIPETVDYREIYQKMPKRIHRWKLMRLLKKRDRRLKKNP